MLQPIHGHLSARRCAAYVIAATMAGCTLPPLPETKAASEPAPPAKVCTIRMPDGHGVTVPCPEKKDKP